MELRRVIEILSARWLLIVILLGLSVGAAAWFTQQQERLYIARTSLVLDFQTENPFDNARLPAQLSSSYMSTQMDILRSRRVAAEAQRTLAEADKPVGLEIGELLRGLEVEPYRESRVVQIGFKTTNPATAERAADAIAQAYIDTTLELNTEPAKRNAEWFDEQLVVLRERLQRAQARLTDFQQEKGIVALDERLDTETSRLNELSKSLVSAQSETYAVQARQLGVNHPEYQRAVERERSLRRSLASQKSAVLALNAQRDSLDLLAREVETERRNYEATLEGFHRASLQSQFNRTNVSVLTAAKAETDPVSPNVVLNLGSAGFLGLLIGIVIALMLESSSRRVRSTKDLEEDFDVEVLSTY
ncbi:MAG: GNVR domain-containing protein [Pseudomonadota bacterium]